MRSLHSLRSVEMTLGKNTLSRNDRKQPYRLKAVGLLKNSLFEGEIIKVGIAAGFLCGVAEEGELRAHEESAPVEAHLIVAADLGPLLTVETIVESGEVSAWHHTLMLFHWTEVGIDA